MCESEAYEVVGIKIIHSNTVNSEYSGPSKKSDRWQHALYPLNGRMWLSCKMGKMGC